MYYIRGFQSSSEPLLHFGLADIDAIEKITIQWPDNTIQEIIAPKINQRLSINYKQGTPVQSKQRPNTLVTKAKIPGLNFVHREKKYDDFAKEILIPHKQSQLGPFLSKGDVNKDGLEDVFVGGAKNQSAILFLQTKNGGFKKTAQTALQKDAGYEDMGSTFFDADQDGDLDLYVVSGSNEFENEVNMYQDRLYLNDGNGTYTKSNGLPKITSSGARITAGDIDQDGDIDLFVGGKVSPQSYPHSPKSYLLINQGGKFVDKTAILAPGLSNAGMITDASFIDVDQDKDLDLVTVGEWSPITVWKNNNSKLKANPIENTEGWWFSILSDDLDGDGDLDLLAGNIGLNHKFKAAAEQPFHIYYDDFDNTGTQDIVLAFHADEKLFPVRGRDCSSEQMPFITDKFPTFESFGGAELHDIFGDKIQKANHLEAKQFASVVLWNEGGDFTTQELPLEAQFSAINQSQFLDLNADGKKELIVAGNMFQTEAETSRADASVGAIFTVEGKSFKPFKTTESGFFAPFDAKDILAVNMANGQSLILVANNDGPLQAFTTQK